MCACVRSHYGAVQAIVMLDKFPKARRHALVVARDPALESIAALRAQHLPLLRHMRTLAEDWARQQRQQAGTPLHRAAAMHACMPMMRARARARCGACITLTLVDRSACSACLPAAACERAELSECTLRACGR